MKATMKREYGVTENGNDIFGRWVLRDAEDNVLEINKYQIDILDRWESRGYEITQIGD